MHTLRHLVALFALFGTIISQNVTVPSTCIGNTTAGHDEVLFTVPYTYAQVLTIIGSFKNLTYQGNPPDTVTLNGTDNAVGTARSYDIDGAHLIETIFILSSPPGGPFNEVHTAAAFYFPPANLYVYIPYDGTSATSICDGKATQLNFTANYCADNATTAGQALHAVHLMDAQNIGLFLGGQNFTSCEALSNNASATTSSGAPMSTFTGGAVHAVGTPESGGLAAVLIAWISALLMV